MISVFLVNFQVYIYICIYYIYIYIYVYLFIERERSHEGVKYMFAVYTVCVRVMSDFRPQGADIGLRTAALYYVGLLCDIPLPFSTCQHLNISLKATTTFEIY